MAFSARFATSLLPCLSPSLSTVANFSSTGPSLGIVRAFSIPTSPLFSSKELKVLFLFFDVTATGCGTCDTPDAILVACKF